MNEQNANLRNPESNRQQKLFEERERSTWEAYKNAQNPTPKPLKERIMKYRAGVLRKLIEEANPDKSASWKEARLRSLLGLPEPVKARQAPTQEEKIPAHLKAAMKAANERIARRFGIKNPGEIQYR